MELGLGLFISLISFLSCIVLTSLIGRTKYFSFLSHRENRYRNIDGLRGFLALSVFFHHFVITYYWKVEGKWQRPPEELFQNFGKVGVAIFFMITGFLFFSRIMDKNRSVKWITLFKSRVFRIYPLYLFALFVITIIVFSSSSFQSNVSVPVLIKQYVNWGLFIGGSINEFSDTNRIIAGVDWTLKYEWLFYLSLPLIFIISRVIGKWGLILLGLLSLILFYFPTQISFFSSVFLIYFAIGATASHYSSKYEETLKAKSNLISTLSLVLVILILIYPNTLDTIHVLMMSILFFFAAAGNNMFGTFSSRAAVVLGEISYSIYLLHGIILYITFTEWSPIVISDYTVKEFLLLMPLLSILVVLVSTVTFLVIEKPAVETGRKFKVSMTKYKLLRSVFTK